MRMRMDIGWPRTEFCRRLRCDEKTVWNWENAVRGIPAEVMTWLEAVHAALRKLPPPDFQTLRPNSGRQPEETA